MLLVPLGLLVSGAAGLWPFAGPHRSQAEEPRTATDPTLLGASGILPQTEAFSPAALAAAGTVDPGPLAVIPAGPLPIPAPASDAYLRVERVLARVNPECGLSWPLLAGLGRVISHHGAGDFDPKGTTTRLILGPSLNGGPGLATVPDTDKGRLDADNRWDRAAGPMQIIPLVWRGVGADSDADGKANPHNIYDAALGAGRFLCRGGADLRDAREQASAVFRYRQSEPFVRATIAWSRAYAGPPVTTPAGAAPAELPSLPAAETLPLSPAPRLPDQLPPGPITPPAALVPAPPPGPAPVPGRPAPPPATAPPPAPPPTQPPPTVPPPTEPPPTVPPTEPPPTVPPTTEPPPTEPPPAGPPPAEPPPA